MSLALVASNVIVSARQFNPSVFSQLWLVRNGLIGESEFGPGCMFSEAFVQVVSPQFMLLVVPDQFQFAPNSESEDQQTIITDKVGTIIDRLPHTPYIAMGFNFVWHMKPEGIDSGVLGRNLFFKNESELFRRFDTVDARFGAYLSRDSLDARLKLDIKPISVVNPLEPLDHSDSIQFAFNYHLDLRNPAQVLPQIHRLLGRWNEAKSEALQIVESIQPRG